MDNYNLTELCDFAMSEYGVASINIEHTPETVTAVNARGSPAISFRTGLLSSQVNIEMSQAGFMKLMTDLLLVKAKHDFDDNHHINLEEIKYTFDEVMNFEQGE